MENQNVGISNEELLKKEYIDLKAKLQDIEKHRKGKAMFLVCIFCSLLATIISLVVLLDILDFSLDLSTIIISLVFGGLIGTFSEISINLIYEIKEGTLRRKILEYESNNTQKELTEDIFENSIKMSYKYLDQYYLQTREQSQRGFLATMCVAIFGASLIFAGVIGMFWGKVQPSYITCASGVITEFIAAVFFYLYNKTVSSMSKYHNKLVLSQNVSIALKVADSLPTDDKVKTKNMITTELLKDINAYLVKSDDE